MSGSGKWRVMMSEGGEGGCCGVCCRVVGHEIEDEECGLVVEMCGVRSEGRGIRTLQPWCGQQHTHDTLIICECVYHIRLLNLPSFSSFTELTHSLMLLTKALILFFA